MNRRLLTATALAGVATLALTGCANPAGVDGVLTDDWAAVAEPVGLVPKAGECHLRFEEVGYLHSYEPVDCGQSHQAETVHVGEFTGVNAGLAEPPESGSPGMKAARADCEERINEALGGPWRSGPMAVQVVLPSPQGWSGGARWYRCDVAQSRSPEDESVLIRSGSLKGSLAGASDLRYGCFRPTLVDGDVTEMAPVACTEKHRAEFVGVWDAPAGNYLAFIRNEDKQYRACRRLVAKYVKVPDDGDLIYRTGTIVYPPNRAEWDNGSRGTKCFLWSDDKDLTRSLKGAGTRGLPINYA
nr:septum formation family protein [Micromonospora sp. DSM 115978]